MTAVSIIVPVYNAEQYIETCIRSILRQSCADFELILVDDGSRDASGALCDREARTDSRIKVVHVENGGVSAARNRGLEMASGEWIAFVDSDDWIETDYLQQLLDCATSTNHCNWVTSGLTFRYVDGSCKSEMPNVSGAMYASDSRDFLRIASQGLVTSPVGKLYSRKLIIENGLRFDTALSFGEDRDFNVRYLKYCLICVATDYRGYNYRKDIPVSLSTVKKGDTLKGDIDYWNRLYDIFSQKEFLCADARQYLVNRLYFFISDAVMSAPLSKNHLAYLNEHVNWEFLQENLAIINAGKIIKYLISRRYLRLLNTVILWHRD
jgi:glycosyltransferase